MSIKYEGGRADGFTATFASNVTVAYYGQRGEETKYVRTDRTDAKGRVIFAEEKK